MDNKALTEMIEQVLNTSEEVVHLEFLNNTDSYNEDNLVVDNIVQGIVRLRSSTPNTIQLDNDSNNRTDVYEISLLIPLSYEKLTIIENQVELFIPRWNNQTLTCEDTIFFTSGTTIEVWEKYSTTINGEEYEIIQLSFTASVYNNFLYGNDRALTINNVDMTCVIDVSLSSQMQFNPQVANDGTKLIKNQDAGLSYNIVIDFVYDTSNTIHQTLITDWQLENSYAIVYKIGALTFSKTCKLQNYSLIDITGDVIKLRLTFVELGVV